MASQEGHAHIWTRVNPPSVSYLATWQHGNDKLDCMRCSSHTWTRCCCSTPGSTWQWHHLAPPLSKAKCTWPSPASWGHSVPDATRLLSARDGRRLDEVRTRCHQRDERIETQRAVSFTSPVVWPLGGGKGCGYDMYGWHGKKHHQLRIVSHDTSIAVSTRVFTKSVHILAPKNRTLDLLKRQ